MSGKQAVLPKLNLGQVTTNDSVKSGWSSQRVSKSARIAEPPKTTSVSSSYLNTAREVVFNYRERNGPGEGGLGETRSRHRLRGYKGEGPVLKRIDFTSDKAIAQLPEYLRVKQEGINAVTTPRSPKGKRYKQASKGASSPNNTGAASPGRASQSNGGTLDLSFRKLGDDYTYAAIKALGTTVHRTDLDYLVKTELSERAYHTLSEGEESEEDEVTNGDARQQEAARKVRRRKKKHGYGNLPEQKHHAITYIDLRDNRLSDGGLVKILGCLRKDPSLAPFLRSLDLSGNTLRKKGAEELGNLVRDAHELCLLSIEKSRIDDTGLRALCRSMRQGGGGALTSLNLSGNRIGDAGCVALAKLLRSPATVGAPSVQGAQVRQGHDGTRAPESDEEASSGPSALALKSLDLSWNDIQSQGAIALINAIGDNTSLQKFDLSWNAIGSTTNKADRPVAAAMSATLARNSTLLHLDMSQNQLDARDCDIIGAGLRENHTLLGLHMTGNQGSVDCYGNLVPDANPWPRESGHVSVMTRICNSEVTGREQWMLRNNCWLCGCHREVRFEYVLSLRSIKMVMDGIMADPAKMAVLDAKRAAVEAKKKREKEMETETDPQDDMVGMPESPRESGEEAQAQQEPDADIPTLDESVAPTVKFFGSFDQWVPEQMGPMPPGKKLSADYLNRTVRLPPAGTAMEDHGRDEGMRSQHGASDAKYPYRGLLRLNRLPVTEEDARAVASSALAFSLSSHTRRRYSDSGSSEHEQPLTRGNQGGEKVAEDVLERINNEMEVDDHREEDVHPGVDDQREEDAHPGVDDQREEDAHPGGAAAAESGSEEKEAQIYKGGAAVPVAGGEEGKDEEKDGAADTQVTPPLPARDTYALDEDDNDRARAADSRPRYALHRMVPPGVHYYCMQVNDHALTFDPFQPHVSTLSLIKLGLQGPLSHLLESANASAGSGATATATTTTTKPKPPPETKPESPTKGGRQGQGRADKKKDPAQPRPASPDKKGKGRGGRKAALRHKKHHRTRMPLHSDAKAVETAEKIKKRMHIKTNEELLAGLPRYVNCITVHEQTTAEKLMGPAAMITSLKPRVKNNDTGPAARVWTFRDSLFFNKIKKHDTAFISTCFMKDWDHCRTSKGKVKADVDGLEELLSSHIKELYAIFAHYSCLYSSEVFMMSMAALNELVTKTYIIETSDGKNCAGAKLPDAPSGSNSANDASDEAEGSTGVPSEAAPGGGSSSTQHKGATRTEIELIFVAGAIYGPRHELNSKRALCRFQFLDALVAIANIKFVKTQKCPDIVSATTKLIEEHLLPYAERDDGNKFREQFVYTEECDVSLRRHLPALERIYKSFSGAENTPLEDYTMSFREWTDMCEMGALDEDNLSERSMKLAYVNSLFPYLDLFDETLAFRKMTKFEFFECMVRSAYAMHRANLVQQYMEHEESAKTVRHGASEEAASLEMTAGAETVGDSLSALSADDFSGSVVNSSDTKKHPSRATDSVSPTLVPEISSTKEFAYIFDQISSKRAIQGIKRGKK